MSEPLLEAENLTIQYETKDGMLTAVSNASFTVDSGEFFGLAGESGSGKSTLAKSIIGGLDENGRITSGTIRYEGKEIQDISDERFSEDLRWTNISWIPQGSMNSLDPLQRVSEQALEIADVHTELTEDAALEKFKELFDVVGLQQSRIHDYPHQFSGGMQQRAIIALALFLDPDLIIADEPTTALDVIMQDQIFKYLDKIKAEDTSLLLITHDISVIFESCDTVTIMHASQIAEHGGVMDVYNSPRHPYAILFKDAFPDIREPHRDLQIIDGHPPQLLGDVEYCSFVERCPWATEECREAAPPLEAVEDGGDEQYAACFRKTEAYREYSRDDFELASSAKGDSD